MPLSSNVFDVQFAELAANGLVSRFFPCSPHVTPERSIRPSLQIVGEIRLAAHVCTVLYAPQNTSAGEKQKSLSQVHVTMLHARGRHHDEKGLFRKLSPRPLHLLFCSNVQFLCAFGAEAAWIVTRVVSSDYQRNLRRPRGLTKPVEACRAPDRFISPNYKSNESNVQCSTFNPIHITMTYGTAAVARPTFTELHFAFCEIVYHI